jgi:hypothetical protein
VFDVTTRHFARGTESKMAGISPNRAVSEPGPHLVDRADYPEHDNLDQYIVIVGGRISVYRNWFLDYSLETITPFSRRAGSPCAATGTISPARPTHPTPNGSASPRKKG